METKQYLVTWEIDIEAETPQDACKIALDVQRRPGNEAVFFTAIEQKTGIKTDVDLFHELTGEEFYKAMGEEEPS